MVHTSLDTGDDDITYNKVLHDMYEVSAAKKKDSAPSKMPAVLPVIPSRRVGSALNFY